MRFFLLLILINVAVISYSKNVNKELREDDKNTLVCADSLIRLHNYSKALSVINNYNLNSDNDFHYYNLKGLIYYYLKEYEKAIVINDSVINNFIGHSLPADTILSKIYNNQGLNYLMLGDYVKSIYYLEKSREIKQICYPDDEKALINVYINLSILYKRIGEFECTERSNRSPHNGLN